RGGARGRGGGRQARHLGPARPARGRPRARTAPGGAPLRPGPRGPGSARGARAPRAAGSRGAPALPVVGLAKEKENVAGEKMVDRVYLPGQKNGIPLRSTSSALFFLARIRDEAHRFANHARKKLGKVRRLPSEIDDIPGLGPSTRKALGGELGSL